MRKRLLAKEGAPESFLHPKDLQRQPLSAPGANGEKGNGKGGKPSKQPRKARKSEQCEGQGEAEPSAPAIPKHNKKMSNKITVLSSKLTEIRCLQTQLKSATMCHAWLVQKNKGETYTDLSFRMDQNMLHAEICSCMIS